MISGFYQNMIKKTTTKYHVLDNIDDILNLIILYPTGLEVYLFCLSLWLNLYFVYASSEGSCGSEHLCSFT